VFSTSGVVDVVVVLAVITGTDVGGLTCSGPTQTYVVVAATTCATIIDRMLVSLRRLLMLNTQGRSRQGQRT
jgi:hypothetical protein